MDDIQECATLAVLSSAAKYIKRIIASVTSLDSTHLTFIMHRNLVDARFCAGEDVVDVASPATKMKMVISTILDHQ